MFTILEIIEILITIVAVSYILKPYVGGRGYKQAAIISTFSIVFHELAHKFVALSFGFRAVYHANIWGLGIGFLFRIMGLPLFFIPAYVSISGSDPLGFALTALAGPLTNLSIYVISFVLLRYFSHMDFVYENAQLIYSLMRINMLLAIFNMIPIPGTDGYNAISALRYL